MPEGSEGEYMKKIAKILAISVATLVMALLVAHIAFAAAGGAAGMALQSATRYLNLTSTQQTQARAIVKDAFQQAKDVLTPAQFAQVKSRRSTMKALKLTREQRAQIKPIREKAKADVQAIEANPALNAADKAAQLRALRLSTLQQIGKILTPAQRQQVKGSGIFRPMNISEAQRAQLHGIRDKALAQFRTILSTTQQAKLDQFLASHPEMTE